MTVSRPEVYLDDVPAERLVDEGLPFLTRGRTLTEADIIAFAGVTGDWNPAHCNEQWAVAHSPFGGRIVHGLLMMTAAAGPIFARLPQLGEVDAARVGFKRAIRIGETVVARGHVLPAANARDVAVRVVSCTIEVGGEIAARAKLSFAPSAPATLDVASFGQPVIPIAALNRNALDCGCPYRSADRMLGDCDIPQFNAVSGDWNRRVTGAAGPRPGTPTVPALLVAAIAAGQVPLDLDRMVAARRSSVRFGQPVLVGDVVHSEGRLLGEHDLGEELREQEWDWRVHDKTGRVAAQMSTAMLVRPA